MLAAAAGKPYNISYGGHFGFQYTAEVFNLGGETVGMDDIIREIEAAEPSARGTITYDNKPLPFPVQIDNAPLTALLGTLRVTPLARGVAESIKIFKIAISEGSISAEQLNSWLT